jgi:hypothetical protein
MRCAGIAIGFVCLAGLAIAASAQQSSTPPASTSGDSAAASTTTVRGCLDGERGNYVLVENKTGLAYVLKGVGNKLNRQLHHEVEVKGRILGGTVKTGIRAEKAGSNPADTVHGVDGVPFQVDNIQTDIRTISKKCTAADQE